MKDKKSKRIILNFALSFCILIFTFCIFSKAQAATLYFSPSSGSYTVGSTLSTNVYVSSAEQAMNAASGIILFPQDKLEVTSLSKSGSIFTLWVQESSFSNSAGTVNFEGIVLNPGFTGASGKVITINFRVKAAGVATFNFSSGSVLANDGKGTNILASLENAQFSLGGAAPTAPTVPEATTPSVVSGAPSAPAISSPTHPDPNKWYSNNSPEFSWKLPSDVNGVSIFLSKSPTSNPGPVSDGLFGSKSYENIKDGIWYFHIKMRNSAGWGPITHFKIQIDTQPPASFSIKVIEGDETANPQPIIVFETTDEMSGIDYYEVKIDQEPLIEIKEKEYKLPVQKLGTHTIIVKAADKAGNYTLTMAEINILSIEAPVITDYPKTLLPSSILSIKGTAVPEATIKVYIQKDEKEMKMGETKSDKEGKWVYIEVEPVEKGIYKVWAEAIDSLEAKSEPSEKVTIQVIPPAFIRIGRLAIDYLTVIITLLVLILVIVLGIIWGWQKIKQRKRVLKKEITEAEKALYGAFNALREETKEQIAKLDGESGLSEREKKIYDDLKKALNISEKFIGKEIKDIEKELE